MKIISTKIDLVGTILLYRVKNNLEPEFLTFTAKTLPKLNERDDGGGGLLGKGIGLNSSDKILFFCL